jgi:hypothetical protein
MTADSGDEAAREARRRRDSFHIGYGEGHDFEADVLRDCLVATHRFLAEISGEMAADAALDALVGSVFGGKVAQGGWRDKLSEHEGELYSDLPMGQVFHDLNAYAHHGVVLSSEATPDERRETLRRLLEVAGAFVALIPLKEWNIDGSDLSRTLILARGRWALDNDCPIEAPALAAFGGVSEQRVRNMMSKTEGSLRSVSGRIPAKDALDWLRKRPKHFRLSVWLDQEPDALPGIAPGRLERVVFTPVAADGSVFHPGLRRKGFFLLGAEAEDLRVASFEEALEALQTMNTPVWRRPTGREHWTRVQGIHWERATMDDLEALALPE